MLKQVVQLLSGVGLSKFLQFLYFFSTATYCSKEEFGSYVFVLTLNLVFVYPVLEWGTELLINQHTAQENLKFFTTALTWKFLVFPLLFISILIYAVFYSSFDWKLVLLGIVLIFIRSLEQSSYAFFRGKGHVEYEAMHLSISRFLSLGLLISTIWWADPNAYHIFLFQIIGSSVSLIWVHQRFETIQYLDKPNLERLKKLLYEGFPLALTALSWIIYFKIDVLMIGNFLEPTQSGYYEVAYKILELTLLIPNVIMAVYFRELVLKAETSEVIRSFWKGVLFLLIPSLFILTIGITMVPYGVELFLRPNQQIVSSVFQILVWSIPICYVGHLTTQMLVVQGRRKTYLSIMLSGALIYIIMNYYLIPIFDLNGAAYATLMTEVFILVMTGVFSVFLIYKPRTLA